MVERLFLAVPRGCLQFVIVVFPDHTHLLFLVYGNILRQVEGDSPFPKRGVYSTAKLHAVILVYNVIYKFYDACTLEHVINLVVSYVCMFYNLM